MSDLDTLRADAEEGAAFDRTHIPCDCGGDPEHWTLWRPCVDWPHCADDCKVCHYAVCACGGSAYIEIDPRENAPDSVLYGV